MESTNNNDCRQQTSEAIRWFKNEEFYWRSLASGIWLLMLLPLFLSIFIFANNISIFSPFTWIFGSISQILSLHTIMICILLQICAVIVTIAHSRSLDVCKMTHSTVMKFIFYMIRPKQLVNIICFTITAFVITFFAHKLTYDTNNSKWNESDLVFLWPYSILLGVVYTIEFYKKHEYVAQFPIIQQKRIFRIKKAIYPCFWQSIFMSFKVLRIYYLLHLILCLVPSLISKLLFTDEESTSIWSVVLKLLSIRLFWSCFYTSVLANFILRLSNELLKIFNTQLYQFPLQATMIEDTGKTLCDAMTSSNLLLKYLGCLDFCSLSRLTGPRRQKIFHLSPPGNQPHLWNTTSMECLRILENSRMNLLYIYDQKQQSKFRQVTPPPKTVGVNNLLSPSQIESIDKNKNVMGENISSPGRIKLANQITAQSPFQQNVPPPMVSNKGLIKEDELFNNLPLVLWCIEGLCNIVAASINDDTYGVVQRKLPDVIIELLLLLEACDMYTKISLAPTSITPLGDIEILQQNTTQAMSLKLALKTGLYTITTAFGYHASAIRLPHDHKKRLHAFLEYAE